MRRFLVVALLASGCLENFAVAPGGDGGGSPTENPTPQPDLAEPTTGMLPVEDPNHPMPPPIVTTPAGDKVGPRALRRLSVREYDNTVRDVFALGDDFSSGLPPDRASHLGFDNDSSLLTLDAARAQDFTTAAELVASTAMAKGFASLGACATIARPCAVAVVDKVAPLLFRRAPSDAEKQRYLMSYDKMIGLSATANDALEWTLVALLNSPNFLYRFELGAAQPDGTFKLTGEELATALAYGFSASPPSAELLQKGRSGALDSSDTRLTEARALLQTARGKEMVQHFLRRWLAYDEVRTLAKDENVIQNWSALRGDMAEETRRFLEHVFFTIEGKVADLFTSRDTFPSQILAQHYGMAPPAQNYAAVQRAPEQALGLLAQGSILARFALTDGTSPPQRGAFVRERLLCQELPPPPPNVGDPPVATPGVTTRERYAQVTAGPACAGCHKLINDVGFALENFDTAGRWRTMEQGKPVDASGTIFATTGGDLAFSDGKDLAGALAASADVARCVGGRMAQYTFGTVEGEKLASPARVTGLADGSLALREFFAQLAAAPHFATRAEQ